MDRSNGRPPATPVGCDPGNEDATARPPRPRLHPQYRAAPLAASVGWGKGALFARRAHADGVAAGSASLFSVFTGQVPHVAAPIRRQVAACNILFETAVRPIADAADESMFYGIEVNVINMPLKVGIVPDRVLPLPVMERGGRRASNWWRTPTTRDRIAALGRLASSNAL